MMTHNTPLRTVPVSLNGSCWIALRKNRGIKKEFEENGRKTMILGTAVTEILPKNPSFPTHFSTYEPRNGVVMEWIGNIST